MRIVVRHRRGICASAEERIEEVKLEVMNVQSARGLQPHVYHEENSSRSTLGTSAERAVRAELDVFT